MNGKSERRYSKAFLQRFLTIKTPTKEDKILSVSTNEDSEILRNKIKEMKASNEIFSKLCEPYFPFAFITKEKSSGTKSGSKTKRGTKPEKLISLKKTNSICKTKLSSKNKLNTSDSLPIVK